MNLGKLTYAEERALEATALSAFPLNLHEIRNNIYLLLGEFGKYGFYNEYTNHNYSHVQAMLEMCDWIIPEKTKSTLTSGDWLFITLSIYFHDLGLLITRKEYEKRDSNSEFKKFLDEPPISGSELDDYLSKVAKLGREDRDRFNYQEFVRYTHGARVQAWIEGAALDDGEASFEIRKVIGLLIGKMEAAARADLAKICRSHTKDDIADTAIYKVSRPYGQEAAETVNLQYVAVILRTVDLLHITNGRAPSALYQFVNPTDPISQLEWQKQGAVRSIRRAFGKDAEGRASENAESNTIEVHARFKESDGFFGLTSYISYVRSQLSASYNAVKSSEALTVRSPKFPWRYIDDSEVEAEGFLTESFGFELDQQKILDLLTGHTLYNDTNVVLRELTQNALDAVRLQSELDQVTPRESGLIKIYWNSSHQVLEVWDNGTGMSQQVIVNHLLKVGSSRYQDPKFKEKHPDFSSISRFGIGVLSAFMVADNVEITTCSLEDEQARTISLRSVHGKYLIKLHDKISERNQVGVYPHGTRVKLSIRKTAKIGNVLDLAKMWLVFPACKVEVSIDDRQPICIGYESPKHALQEYIKSVPYFSLENLDVREHVKDGLTLAFAVSKNSLFHDWSFVVFPERMRGGEDEIFCPISTCIEGVSVDFSAPGFRSRNIVAVANTTGKYAPKTNVARSALEDTDEYRNMLSSIYSLYAEHVKNEVNRLSSISGYSLSRAVEQAPYIAAALGQSDILVKPSSMEREMSTVPMLIFESSHGRKNGSVSELLKEEQFWTVESPLISSVEQFVRESPKNISATTVLERLQDKDFGLPEGITVCNMSSSGYVEKKIRENFEPSEISANAALRRLSMNWSKVSAERKWFLSFDLYTEVGQNDRRMWEIFSASMIEVRGRYRDDVRGTYVPIGDVKVTGLEEFGSFLAMKDTFLNPHDPLAKFLRAEKLSNDGSRLIGLCGYLMIIDQFNSNYFGAISKDSLRGTIDRLIQSAGMESLLPHMNMDAFSESLGLTNFSRFSPFAWKRREDEI